MLTLAACVALLGLLPLCMWLLIHSGRVGDYLARLIEGRRR